MEKLVHILSLGWPKGMILCIENYLFVVSY